MAKFRKNEASLISGRVRAKGSRMSSSNMSNLEQTAVRLLG